MFLLSNRRLKGTGQLVFFRDDPRGAEDFPSGVTVDVATLTQLPVNSSVWPSGTLRPGPTVTGVSFSDLTHFQEFRDSAEANAAGFEVEGQGPRVFDTWADFVRQYPPDKLV